jgi:hypothetical protein
MESGSGVRRYVLVRRRFVWLGLVAIALGVAVLLYRGPGRAVVRGHVGDVAATMLVYAAISMFWSVRMRTRAIATFAIAAAIEIGQLVWNARSLLAELTIGSSFDAWDFVAYAIGVGAAVAWETLAVNKACTVDGGARTASAAPRAPVR